MGVVAERASKQYENGNRSGQRLEGGWPPQPQTITPPSADLFNTGLHAQDVGIGVRQHHLRCSRTEIDSDLALGVRRRCGQRDQVRVFRQIAKIAALGGLKVVAPDNEVANLCHSFSDGLKILSVELDDVQRGGLGSFGSTADSHVTLLAPHGVSRLPELRSGAASWAETATGGRSTGPTAVLHCCTACLDLH